MQPSIIEDPRDKLEKMTRWDLYKWAAINNVVEVKEPMPADLAATILRGRGLVNPPIELPPLGTPAGAVVSHPTTQSNVAEVDAAADLARQYAEQQTKEMTFGELCSELKRRGIKFKRTDRMDDLKAKLDGQ